MNNLYNFIQNTSIWWLKRIFVLVLLTIFIGLNGCRKNNVIIDQKIESVFLDKNYLNKNIEREIGGKGYHVYKIKLLDNQYVSFDIEQDGIDISIELISPKNELLMKYDNQLGIKGKEHFGFVSQETGQYSIRVNPTNNTAILGKYLLNLRELRSAEEKDKKWFEAIKLLSLGKEKIEEQGERINKGIEEVLSSIEKFKTLKDDWHLSCAFNYVGNGYLILGDIAKAEESYNQTISINQKLKDPHLEVYSLDSLGLIASSKGDFQKSIQFHNQALEIVTQLKDDGKKAYLLNNLANNFVELGEMEKSAGYLSEAKELHLEYGRSDQLALTMFNLAIVYGRLGEFEKCIPIYADCLKTTDNLRVQAYVKHGLSVVYSEIGDLDSAEKYNTLSYEDFQKVGDSHGLLSAFGQRGTIFISRGDKAKAVKALKSALELAKDVPVLQSVILSKIGFIEQRLGNKEEGYIFLSKALAICEEKEMPFQKMLVLLSLGKTEAEKSNYPKAMFYLEDALKLAKDLKISRFEAEILFNLATIAFKQGNMVLVEKTIKECLEASKLVRASISLQEFQLFLSSKVKDYYDLYIEILILKYKKTRELQYLENAWKYLEESRARVLLEILRKNSSFEHNSDSDLVKQEATLRKRIAANLKEKIDILNKSYNLEKLNKLELQALELKTQYQKLELQMKKQQPQRLMDEDSYSDLTISTVQKELLDDNSTILEYHFGVSNYVFRIEKNKFDYFELPTKELDKATDIIKNLKVFTPPSDNQKLEERKVLYLKELNSIYRTLLRETGENLKSRLIIVPDGLVSQIPWSALVDNENKFLLVNHEISVVPSIKTLISQKQVLTNANEQAEEGLVFADPVYELVDQRVKSSDMIAKNENTYKSIIEQSMRNLGLRQGFSRIPFTEKEANSIKIIYPKTTVFLGVEANLEKIFSLPAKKYKFIHFGTHGFSNNSEPNLSSLVLSLYNEGGEAQNGYLTVPDINRLKISANLVVLSACQTGQGKQVKGEGSIGLSWGFMSNKSPRIISTLWNISDEFTSLLMSKFYQKMLLGKQRPAQALRESQLEMMKEEKWSDPYYWGSFSFQGIWD